jgi:hypothetical protein
MVRCSFATVKNGESADDSTGIVAGCRKEAWPDVDDLARAVPQLRAGLAGAVMRVDKSLT